MMRRPEPARFRKREEPQIFTRLIFHALAEDLVSESKAAQLMDESLVEFRAVRKWTMPRRRLISDADYLIKESGPGAKQAFTRQ